MKVGIDHGRLTARAIALVHPTQPITQHLEAETAMRELLAFRDEYAESWAIWREWFINREAYVPNMQNYWEYVLGTPGYTLTVESGSGDGIYSAGAVVPASADPPPSGKTFHHWAGDTDGVADVFAADTTITMPASAANIRATYSYTLEVINGSGSGMYGVGEVVPISADAPAAGEIFVRWTGDAGHPDMDFTNQKLKWSITPKTAKVKKGLLTVKEVLENTPCTLTATYGKKDSTAQGTLGITILNTGP